MSYLVKFISIQARGSLIIRAQIRANPGLNFNPSFFFFCLKEFSQIIFAILFRPSNHQTVDKRNETDFAF